METPFSPADNCRVSYYVCEVIPVPLKDNEYFCSAEAGYFSGDSGAKNNFGITGAASSAWTNRFIAAGDYVRRLGGTKADQFRAGLWGKSKSFGDYFTCEKN